MHLEYSRCVRKLLALLAEEFPRFVEDDDARSAVIPVLRSAPELNFTVEDCPQHVEREIAATAPFVLAAKLRAACGGQRRAEFAPGRIAAVMIDLQRTAEPVCASGFEIVVGSSGFLNATPTDWFAENFLRAACAGGSISLFAATASPFAEHLQSAAETGAGQPFEIEFDIDELIRRAVDCAGDDAAQLAAKIRAGEQNTRRDDLLMLVALLANPEIELWPYLSGRGSWQNVPGYLCKFAADWRSFAAQLAAPAAASMRRELELQSVVSDLWRDRESDAPALREFRRCLRELFRLRGALQLAAERRRPELAVAAVLQIVREFYSFYNRPEVRALACRANPSLPAPVLGELVAVIGRAVEGGIGSLALAG